MKLKKIVFRSIVATAIVGMIGFIADCSQPVSFKSGPTQNSSSTTSQSTTTPSNSGCGNGSSGTTTIQNYTGDLRVIVMVDNSGSTLQTDPNFYYRQQTLTNFLAKYGNKTNFTYAFGEFGADQVNIYDNSLGGFVPNPANPFGTAANLQTALNVYLKTPIDPSANTPYQLAFNDVTNIIANDRQTGLIAPSYSVIFMSDGMPNPGNSISELKTMVANVLAAATAKGSPATVSTVYFGTEVDASDMTAMNNLEVMASQGKGQFYDTNHPPAGGLIENVLTIPVTSKSCP